MCDNDTFDRSGLRFIHRCGIFLLLIGIGAGCEQNRPPAAATPDGGPAAAAPADADPAMSAPPPEQDGLFGEGDAQVAQAVGRAPRSVDRSLSRDRAAVRAKGKLLNLLKESGKLPPDAHGLAGVRIARTWNDDNYSYALAILPLKNISNPLNESGSAPSNPSVQKQAAPATPNGGTVP